MSPGSVFVLQKSLIYCRWESWDSHSVFQLTKTKIVVNEKVNVSLTKTKTKKYPKTKTKRKNKWELNWKCMITRKCNVNNTVPVHHSEWPPFRQVSVPALSRENVWRRSWCACKFRMSSYASTRKLLSIWQTAAFQSLMWPVDDIFVPPSASCHHLVVPRHNLGTYGRRAFAVAGSAAWNSLSDDLRDPALSTDSFRRALKTRLFSEY